MANRQPINAIGKQLNDSILPFVFFCGDSIPFRGGAKSKGICLLFKIKGYLCIVVGNRPRETLQMVRFSVEQPRETVPFAEIQFKDIQTLDRIVRFLVVPHERPDFRLKSGLFVFPYCSRRQKESGATGIPHHRATLRNNIPGSEHRIMAATQARANRRRQTPQTKSLGRTGADKRRWQTGG